MKKYLLGASILVSAASLATYAYAGGSEASAEGAKSETSSKSGTIAEAFKNGKAYIDARYRFETVDADGFADEANASTLRTKLGFTTGVWNNFQFGIEAENVSEIAGDDYNSTTNGNTTYPVVADTEGTELNEAWVAFTGIRDTTVKFGRQSVELDNERFIGDVGWRQNDQTYDALAVINTSIKDTTLVYGYVYNVNRINGNDHAAGDLNTDTHLFNAIYSGLPQVGTLTAYGYFLDVDNAATASSKTFGASLVGEQNINEDADFIYRVEYARQSDYGNQPTNYDADYYNIQPGVTYKGLTAKIGYEVLGSDNGVASFATPLATLHSHNGWADIFTATPVNGLEDLSASVSYELENLHEVVDGTSLTLAYHDFSADEGGADYGNEWNFAAKKTINENYTVGVKYANYDADEFSVDTEKLIFTLGVKFSQ